MKNINNMNNMNETSKTNERSERSEATPTLMYYRKNAEAFAEGTRSADMREARGRFLACLPPQAHILDLGCGSGRDTKAFLDLGYRVDAVDGSEKLCRIASEYTGISVRKMLFEELESDQVYDGIWACASILHLPREELRPVLGKIAAALRKGGILYASFKYGTYEGIREGRFYTDFTEEALDEFMKDIPPLVIIEKWMTQDVRPDREEQWINLLAKRV